MTITYPEWTSGRSNAPGWITDENGCDIWTGATDTHGYGQARVDGRTQYVHRVRYEREVGPIPTGEELDHFVCSNGGGGCCNPLHCRPVSHRENLLRGPTTLNAIARAKTHCPRGHRLAGENLLGYRDGRVCRICHNARCRARYHANREEINARRRAAYRARQEAKQ